LIRDPEIDLVLNLTPPQAHAEIGLRVIEAGKSLYTEKPLAAMRNDAHRLLEAAEAKPDQFQGHVSILQFHRPLEHYTVSLFHGRVP
ncbi:MAG: hypothetical protein D3916_02045, partial [Candidatus Electrothrix sp. MAN1_4]|nr:hypothetical protein [Candidatus Electrothrix sp. MAN1_4]